MEFKKKRKL